MLWKQKENTHLELNTIDLSRECLTSFKNYLIPNQTLILDVWQERVKNSVRAKHTVAFHSEITQNQDIYNLICERELPAGEKCLKHSATASKQKEKQSSRLHRRFHRVFWIQERKDTSF